MPSRHVAASQIATPLSHACPPWPAKRGEQAHTMRSYEGQATIKGGNPSQAIACHFAQGLGSHYTLPLNPETLPTSLHAA